jgi:hypothetical protein
VLGILLGEFVKDLVLASAGALPGGPSLGRAAKAAIVLLAVFMALEQLDIAEDIVLVFFIAVVGAAALAAGIAFGLGGRNVAEQITREWYERNRARPPRRQPDQPHPPAGEASPPLATPRPPVTD